MRRLLAGLRWPTKREVSLSLLDMIAALVLGIIKLIGPELVTATVLSLLSGLLPMLAGFITIELLGYVLIALVVIIFVMGIYFIGKAIPRIITTLVNGIKWTVRKIWAGIRWTALKIWAGLRWSFYRLIRALRWLWFWPGRLSQAFFAVTLPRIIAWIGVILVLGGTAVFCGFWVWILITYS